MLKKQIEIINKSLDKINEGVNEIGHHLTPVEKQAIDDMTARLRKQFPKKPT
jgi:hypothetical protein